MDGGMKDYGRSLLPLMRENVKRLLKLKGK